MTSLTRSACAAALAALAAASATAQQTRAHPAERPLQNGETAAFVVTIGSDTLQVEKYTRTPEGKSAAALN